MNKYSGALLRDIRNIKKNQISMTSKNITSSKDIKKVRSSEQLNFHKFTDV